MRYLVVSVVLLTACGSSFDGLEFVPRDYTPVPADDHWMVQHASKVEGDLMVDLIRAATAAPRWNGGYPPSLASAHITPTPKPSTATPTATPTEPPEAPNTPNTCLLYTSPSPRDS